MRDSENQKGVRTWPRIILTSLTSNPPAAPTFNSITYKTTPPIPRLPCTLEVVDVDRKPSYPVAALEPKHVEPHSFDSMTQVVTYLRDKLRDTPLVSPEESAAEVFKMLNRDLTQTERDALFKLLLG